MLAGEPLVAVASTSTSTSTSIQVSASQALVLTEINTSIRQLDTMTQHNAALVAQGSAAVEQPERRAADLANPVNVFRKHPVVGLV